MNNLAKLRKEHRLTQSEVAKDLNIGQSTLSQYERGERRIDDNLLKIFCNYYQTSADIILNLSAHENKKIPKDLKKILEEEEITLNGRMMSAEDKEKIYRVIEVMYHDAKEQNKRK